MPHFWANVHLLKLRQRYCHELFASLIILKPNQHYVIMYRITQQRSSSAKFLKFWLGRGHLLVKKYVGGLYMYGCIYRYLLGINSFDLPH